MKDMFVKLVLVEDTAKMEKILNMYRVGLNDWDRSKVFNYKGSNLVNYTIMCTRETYDAIVSAMKNC